MQTHAWEQVPVPLIAWREDGRVVTVNTAAATALGHNPLPGGLELQVGRDLVGDRAGSLDKQVGVGELEAARD